MTGPSDKGAQTESTVSFYFHFFIGVIVIIPFFLIYFINVSVVLSTGILLTLTMRINFI